MRKKYQRLEGRVRTLEGAINGYADSWSGVTAGLASRVSALDEPKRYEARITSEGVYYVSVGSIWNPEYVYAPTLAKLKKKLALRLVEKSITVEHCETA